jgi:hypothetical protein
MVWPQDVIVIDTCDVCNGSCFVIFHDLHVDEFTTGRSHMVVFVILYALRVNFLYAM